jgi:hypothetical protein
MLKFDKTIRPQYALTMTGEKQYQGDTQPPDGGDIPAVQSAGGAEFTTSGDITIVALNS